MDCEGYIVGLAHTMLKAVRRLRQGVEPLARRNPKAAGSELPETTK